ncbi:hypothetical protein F7725_027912 [Dissostichus mawsoni]|uniref:Aminoacyl-transfer RNA synthetases class-II family profile domain-containing protein n=1 Tax=Dissostichus mawsoni TaxID=36200 RepID=A0A7J5XEF2_DISMA|nr:hypothetical protein F7725_027912 [Dissostichus mawsoni]
MLIQSRSAFIMEPIMNQIRSRVFQRLHRAAVLPRRKHSGCAEQAAVPAPTNSRKNKPTLLVSRLYQPANLRDMGLQGEMTCKSQRLMQQAGLIYQSNPGCYYYLPATVRSMEKLITRKFRDEPKPKFGLLRGREFYMKDMYSFDVSEEAAYETYESVCQAYTRLFARLGLRCVQVQADTGNIGGKLSHEFQLPADIGEDRILVCGNCSFSANVETLSPDTSDCPNCKTGKLEESKGVEVGHTFYLGKKYSNIFNATFSSAQNKPCIAEMGCYGLGVTRILAAAIEVLSTEEGIRWPGLLAPYQACVVPPKKGSKMDGAAVLAEELVHTLGETLPRLRGEVVFDDRTQMTIGKRLMDASRLGYPYVIVVGQGALEETPRFEVICQQTGETMFLSKDGLLDLLGRVETV